MHQQQQEGCNKLWTLSSVNYEQEIIQVTGVAQCEITTLNQLVKTDLLAAEHIIICFQRISRQPELRTLI